MRLMHNLASLGIYQTQQKNAAINSKAASRISSGLKVTNAKDNPEALAKSERMKLQVRGLQMAQRNLQDGVSMLQTVDSSIGNIQESLQKMRELSVQLKNDTFTTEDRSAALTEFNALLGHIDNTIQTTKFNGKNLLTNVAEERLPMQVGNNVGDTIEIPTYNLNSGNLSTDIDGNTVSLKDLSANFDADKAIKVIDASIEKLSSVRYGYGALQNRFESSYEMTSSLSLQVEKIQSEVSDADVAEEMMHVTRTQLLMEAGTALMAQSNNFPKDILRVLENIRRP